MKEIHLKNKEKKPQKWSEIKKAAHPKCALLAPFICVCSGNVCTEEAEEEENKLKNSHYLLIEFKAF